MINDSLVVTLSLCFIAWLIFDTVRGYRAGRLNWQLKAERKERSPLAFWCNMTVRITIIASMAFAAALVLTGRN